MEGRPLTMRHIWALAALVLGSLASPFSKKVGERRSVLRSLIHDKLTAPYYPQFFILIQIACHEANSLNRSVL